MKKTLLLMFVSFVVTSLILVASSGCRKAPSESDDSSKPPLPRQEQVSPEGTQNEPPYPTGRIGRITGRVVFEGTAPPNPRIRMASDPVCAKLHSGEAVYQEVVRVGPDEGLKNVFVHLKKGPGVRRYPPPGEPAVLDQQGCLYHPRVMGAMVGQVLLARNSDPTLHNVHAFSQTRNQFNFAQPMQGMESTFVLADEEIMLQIKCDVHPWMIGYVGVLPHPFFDVSDEKGSFNIEDVPEGEYEIQAWHERFGAISQTVTVRANETAQVTFQFTEFESIHRSPGFKFQTVDLHSGSLRLVYRVNAKR